jgi:hypothetical protein
MKMGIVKIRTIAIASWSGEGLRNACAHSAKPDMAKKLEAECITGLILIAIIYSIWKSRDDQCATK